MAWQKLEESKIENLYRGARIRVEVENSIGSVEDTIVDFMVFDSLGSDNVGLSLVRLTGFKAGHILITFPKESCPIGTRSLSTQWFRENFESTLPLSGSIKSVWITNERLSVRKRTS